MGGAATGAGLGIMGGTLGGIGDIIQATNYERPRLPQPSETERNLRRLGINQLQGGGQQLLGATALYNQMAPLLMGMLPGMTYHPGTTGSDQGGGGGGGPLQSYQDAMANLQSTQQRAQRLKDLNKQIKGMKKGQAGRYEARMERRSLRQQAKTSPDVADMQRLAYRAGTTQNPAMFDIRQASPDSGAGSMAAYRGIIDAIQGNQPQMPDLGSFYQGGY